MRGVCNIVLEGRDSVDVVMRHERKSEGSAQKVPEGERKASSS